MTKYKTKDMESKLISGFNLTKQLQGKVNHKLICGIVNLSNSTISRFCSCNSFAEYKELMQKLTENNKAKRYSDVVLKKDLYPTPNVGPHQIDTHIPSKTNDISKMGEITTMSLLNAILGELKKLNDYILKKN